MNENKTNKFILGDCMKHLPDFADNYFDLAIVDPPYGIKRFEKPSGTTRFGSSELMQKNGLTWDKKPSAEYFKELRRVSKHQIIWGANNFTLPPTEYFIIWNKMQTVDNFATCEYAWTNSKKPAQMFDYSIHKHNQIDKIHPTQKPVDLYRWLLQNYAKPGDLILDTHVGSASSLVACIMEGFDYVGYEIDKEYYDGAMKRIKAEQQKITLF